MCEIVRVGEPRVVGREGFRDAAPAGGEDGETEGEGFEDGEGEPFVFVACGEDEEVGGGEERFFFVGAGEAGEVDGEERLEIGGEGGAGGGDGVMEFGGVGV